MKHTISGNNFHGDYSINFYGEAEGFILSKSQERKLWRALCGIEDCKCGGGYGDGIDRESADYENEYYEDGPHIRLIPLAERKRIEKEEADRWERKAQAEAAIIMERERKYRESFQE